MYSELVYFDGAHFARIVRYAEQARVLRVRVNAGSSVSELRRE